MVPCNAHHGHYKHFFPLRFGFPVELHPKEEVQKCYVLSVSFACDIEWFRQQSGAQQNSQVDESNNSVDQQETAEVRWR